jgi:hypothetical protein
MFATYADMCRMFNLERHRPDPDWTPYAVQLTNIVVLLHGLRVCSFGGARQCGACGFGVDMRPSENTEPKAREDGGCPKCGSLDGIPAPINLKQPKGAV